MSLRSGLISTLFSGKISEDCHHLLGLEGSAPGYLAGTIWSERKVPVVLVTADNAEAERLIDDIGFFSRNMAPGPIQTFPAPTALPYSHLIPQVDTWTERMAALYATQNERAPLIITPITGLLRKVPPPSIFYDHVEPIHIDLKIDMDAFLERLVAAGYNRSPLVEEEGDFAARGFIIDVWSPTTDRPVRIELDGDVVASIRSFDPSTQRTSFTVDRLTIIPVRSVILTEEIIRKGLHRLKVVADDRDVSPVERREYAESVKAGIYPAYTETLLPIFHDKASFLWDYLPKETIYLISNPFEVRNAYQKFWEELAETYSETTHIEKAVRPDELYAEEAVWQDFLKDRRCIKLNSLEVVQAGTEIVKDDHSVTISTRRPIPPVGQWIEGSQEDALGGFVGQLKEWTGEGYRIIAVCHTDVQADRFVDLLRWQGLAPHATDRCFAELTERLSTDIQVMIGELSEGFLWPDERLVVLTEKEIFGKRRKRQRAATGYPTETFTSYQDLSDGDCLVHLQHGIGRFRGMTQMDFNGMTNDFLQVEYLGGDKLFLPVYRLGQIQKYIGPEGAHPLLDKMGGTRWEKAKIKAKRAVRKMASELLKLYATRQVRLGFAFSGRDHHMEEFESTFPFDETPDQMQAIEEVLKGMADPHPTDRLICGDVGYGKTEVAIRAAFRAAMDGKQVALLVPTTILAFQHYETFKGRFKGTPVTIGLLNRFVSKSQQKKLVEDLNLGKVDIVIGTHRLLSKDVAFRDLGLLIIDEEHRFGVRQKERVKRLKETVDVVSMSATPIPRTLHISLVGARDISVINTPPADRLSIRTYVAEFDEGLIKGAVMKEIRRGGQVFFVHNRVETIESMRKRLTTLLPDVRICVGHGQMKEQELEEVMVGFLHKEYDLLLSTTIIESGLDIPSVNTMIINRADTFGLAQLYQLRGRVGRSNIQAFAYLLVPEEAAITPIAAKRLATLQKYTELGSGFQIAMHDLEIRGAGNILGAEQSGHISVIGYELYTELLEREIQKQKGEVAKSEIDTEIQIPVEAFLPSDYVEDNGTRIVFYKRISALRSDEEIDEMAAELTDRFGELPRVAKNLLKIMEIKIKAAALGIEKIQGAQGSFLYSFVEATPVAAQALLELVRKNEDRMKIRPPATLVVQEFNEEPDIFSVIRKHLAEIQ